MTTLGQLTSSQMRNRAVKAYHVQKQLLRGGHQAIPHMKMTEGFLWDAAANILEQGHGAILSLPARRIAENINELCSYLIHAEAVDEEEGIKRCDTQLAQAQIVLDSAKKLCRKGASDV